jgi:3'-5' exoribonuclease
VMWNYPSAMPLVTTGKVCDIEATVTEYNGKLQLTIELLEESADQNTDEFSCTYNDDYKTLWRTATGLIDLIESHNLRNITSEIYSAHKENILRASSAKGMHHVGIGGNISHCIEVCNLAMDISRVLQDANRPVSMDLVIAGALLHDIGKIETYAVNQAVVEYTLNGMLQEHIVTGIRMLAKYNAQSQYAYDNEIQLLSHIIASHHGTLEFGSPVTPKFAEAYIVNMADGISAKMDILFSANDKAVTENRQYTEKIYALNNQEHMLQRDVQQLLKGGYFNAD